ncbi:hypothetical protein [Methylobacterium sp. WL6]|uniref:hypothetical protein n=1 Tax=Methylobacterium sp. WL6 TaxID=2603901 RepID=UPI0011CB9AD1|nr:hypothetical protein [Methylobacterium sp. WL6]RZL19858.1 MAG: hypothetical protein EOP64_10025 [Sphingomonas sp.]TXN71169.1 hypothetical protein FV230_09400 [Methylobacterium sp. WL6]
MDNPVDAVRLAKLSAMATSLGIPVESFFTDTEAAECLSGARECAELWGRIKTAEGRCRALAYLRELVDEPRS